MTGFLVSFPPEDQEEISNWAYGRSRELVDRHWDAVEAVAGALVEKRRLTGQEVSAIVGNLRVGEPHHPLDGARRPPFWHWATWAELDDPEFRRRAEESIEGPWPMWEDDPTGPAFLEEVERLRAEFLNAENAAK